MRPHRTPRSAAELLDQYVDGVTDFSGVDLPDQDFSGLLLRDVNLSGAWLHRANFGDVQLERVCFVGADLAFAEFPQSRLNRCSFRGANVALGKVESSDWRDNDFTSATLGHTVFRETDFSGGDFTQARFGATVFIGCDIRPICQASPTLTHTGPSYVDHTTIMRSLRAPNLHDFLLRTGMPPIFVDYAIDSARAIDNPVLSRMMQSTFISYGGPDVAFARKLYEALHENGVTTFFFPEHAIPGERLHRVMREGVNQYDRVVLVCSEASLTRPGVLNEIEETLAREAREGGETFLIPITLDDYVFTGWAPARPDLAQAIRDRVVADFTGALTDENRFNAALRRLLSALRRDGG